MIKFEKREFRGLQGEVNHIFVLEGRDVVSPCQVVASRAGVSFQGTLQFEDQNDLQEFAKVLSDAWKLHRKAQPNLATNLAGH